MLINAVILKWIPLSKCFCVSYKSVATLFLINSQCACASCLVCLPVFLSLCQSRRLLTINHWLTSESTQSGDLVPFIVLVFGISGWFLRKHEALSFTSVLAFGIIATYRHTVIMWDNLIQSNLIIGVALQTTREDNGVNGSGVLRWKYTNLWCHEYFISVST